MEEIVIIGGNGWLGNYLQAELNNENYRTIITSRTKSASNIVRFNLAEPNQLPWAETYIFCVPPSGYQLDNLDNLKKLIPANTKVIFTSSTSVYSNKLLLCHEETPLLVDDTVNIKVLETEYFFKNTFSNLLIFRLAGLIDAKRHPAIFLSGKKQVEGRYWPVNLVHGLDVAKIITQSIKKDLTGIYNVCCNEHPTKSEYYTKCCKILNISPPEFSEDNSPGKTISNKKIVEALNYKFVYPTPYIFNPFHTL